MTDKPISEMTTDELLALIMDIDAELWAADSIWIDNKNKREYTVTKNMRGHIGFRYVDGWGKKHSGVSSKQTFLETCTRYKDIKNG